MLCFSTCFTRTCYRAPAAADFVSYLTSLDPDAQVKSETIELTTKPTDSDVNKVDDIIGEAVAKKMKKDREKAPNHPGWDKLLHLTDENYEALLAKHKHVFVMFHAKWCSHCREAKPIFAEVAQDHDSALGELAACDTDVSPNMVDNFLISSLPIFKYIRDGKSVVNYTGERTVAGLKEFLQKMKTSNKDEL